MRETNLVNAKVGQVWRDMQEPENYWKVAELRLKMRPADIVFFRAYDSENRKDRLEVLLTADNWELAREPSE